MAERARVATVMAEVEKGQVVTVMAEAEVRRPTTRRSATLFYLRLRSIPQVVGGRGAEMARTPPAGVHIAVWCPRAPRGLHSTTTLSLHRNTTP